MTELATTARAVTESGEVAPADIASLRQAIYADGIVSRAEGTALFDIERTRTVHSDAWSQLFVEALMDYALNQEPPVGCLSGDTAAWITSEVGRRKTPSTDADLELVTNIIEKAREVPASFSAFALGLAKQEVLYGDGPDRLGRAHISGRVTEADVIVLQRILWGAGSEGLLAVSREEAEALVAIADATTGANNVAEFEDLFARAIGNYLIGATGRSVPTRQEALAAQTRGDYKMSLNGVLSAFNKLIRPSVADFKEGMNMRSLTEEISAAAEAETLDRENARDEARAVAEIMTPDKAGWLLDHVGKNGVITGPEKALVRFIERQSSALPPELQAVLAKVA